MNALAVSVLSLFEPAGQTLGDLLFLVGDFFHNIA
jgi:hypothetical protein